MEKVYAVALLVFVFAVGVIGLSLNITSEYKVKNFEFNSTADTSRYSISILSNQSSVPNQADILAFSTVDEYYIQDLIQEIGTGNLSKNYLLSDSAASKVEKADYVGYKGRYYNILLERTGDIGLDIDAELIDSTSVSLDPAVIQMTLKSTSSENISVVSGAPSPLGVLTARGKQGRYVTLWNQDYQESKEVSTRPLKTVTMVNAIGIGTKLAPGQKIKKNYTIYPYQGIQTGKYMVDKTLRTDKGFSRSELQYKLQFRIE